MKAADLDLNLAAAAVAIEWDNWNERQLTAAIAAVLACREEDSCRRHCELWRAESGSRGGIGGR
jgi:hypothetical protein